MVFRIEKVTIVIDCLFKLASFEVIPLVIGCNKLARKRANCIRCPCSSSYQSFFFLTHANKYFIEVFLSFK